MYEDYMQNLLGYRINPMQNTYEKYNNINMPMENFYQCSSTAPNIQCGVQNIDLEKCYPEIYKIIYPMIKKVCMTNTEPITEENIERMVNEIYNNIETGDSITLNINLGNNLVNTTNGNREVLTKKEESRATESRQNNFLMNDLIRILLIRELLGRPVGPRPFPPRPFPPEPPMGRPPMMPRYDEYINY